MRHVTAKQSRRQVQRRFPPGTCTIDHVTSRVTLVVAWVPTPVRVSGYSNRVMEAASWEALVVGGERLSYVKWEHMRENWTLDEWEEK